MQGEGPTKNPTSFNPLKCEITVASPQANMAAAVGLRIVCLPWNPFLSVYSLFTIALGTAGTPRK